MCQLLFSLPAETTIGTVAAAIGAQDALPIFGGIEPTQGICTIALVGPDIDVLIGIACELTVKGRTK